MSMPSDEVALDFQDSLNDLQINNRYEISNLTIIAKENTEHAQAISRTLENHIKRTAPSRKLPALYVLDSIVKNVGTPYTVYLGRNLYSTFMGAYTLVDGQTRKSMEAMLKTWKEPVPGSMDPRPVFSVDVTREIENALIKARTIFVQQQQKQQPSRQTPVDYRNTPTPPENASRYGPPQHQQYQNGYPQQSTPRPYGSHQGAQPAPDLARQLLASLSAHNPANDLAKLHEDINGLITQSQSDFARNPFDQSIQQRLKALLDLQNIVKTQQLAPEAINMIKAQVAQLSAARAPSATPTLHPAQPTWQPPAASHQPYQPPPSVSQPYGRPSSVQPPIPAPAFAPGALEALLASATNGQKPSTPTLRSALPAIQNQSPNSAATAPTGQTGNALVDALRAAGLVTSSSTPQPPSQPPAPAVASTQDLLKTLQNIPALANLTQPPQIQPTVSIAKPLGPRIPLSSTTLKIFRPDLISTLYSSFPNQCTTCGRRFAATETGRAKKSLHLDWHFRTNQRIADAVHKGQHRSWYVDEMEWIQLQEIDESTIDPNDPETSGANGAAKSAKTKKQVWEQYITAPTGAAAAANASCPICQEKFEAVWHEEAQEWVWMDTVKVGGRVYHASCHEEVKKATGGAAPAPAPAAAAAAPMAIADPRARSATPDSSLGKRKAEEPLAALLAKVAKGNLF